MPSTTPAGPGAGLPVAAAAAVPAAGLAAADQAFDDVFRQLTGRLLTTSAEAGEALAETDCESCIEGEGGEADLVADVLPFGVVPVPAMFTLPAVVAPAPVGTGAGEHIDGDVAGSATAAAGAAVATPPGIPGAASAPGAATPVAAPFNPEAAPIDVAPDTAAGEDRDVLAALTLPAEGAGTATPAAEAEAPVRGLDRRRGMRETPARARTFDPAAAATSEPTGTTATPTPVAPAPAGAVTPGTTDASTAAPVDAAASAAPREMPATAERAFALQRALARQQENTHRDSAAPGLAAQVAEINAGTGSGTDAGGDGEPSGKKRGRAWTSAVGPVAALPATPGPAAQAIAVAGLGQAAPQGEPTAPGPVASAAWRAAFASSALAEAVGAAVESTRGAAASGLLGVLPPAVELTAIRDRGPLVVDTPLAMPELDAATGEAVHTQIVKSLRMQWTGGMGEARVTLKPEYLGEVTASIKVEQGVVTATLQADTPEVRRWMESHTATLRDALVDHGLKLDRLTVSEPDRQAAQGDRQGKPRQQPRDQAPRPRARREASETDVPFEVTTD